MKYRTIGPQTGLLDKKKGEGCEANPPVGWIYVYLPVDLDFDELDVKAPRWSIESVVMN